MAQNIITTVTFRDDLKGTEFAEGEGETITYAWEGTNYEIDLTTANAAAFRKAMEKYVSASRVVTGKKSGTSRNDLNEVRAWAKGQGMQVAERGRVSVAVLAAFDKAMNEGDEA